VLVEVVGCLLNGIECDPIAPYRNFTPSASQLDCCIAVVFVAIIIVQVQFVFCHWVIPLSRLPAFYGKKVLILNPTVA
jgi:hypothetical protein